MAILTKRFRNDRTSGFTIIELLIVIVVIGILAALVLNAFAGAQASARNAVRIQAAKAYYNILVAYKATNGVYPGGSGVAVCLGENYDDYSADGVGDCKILNGSAANRISVSTAFNQSLVSVTSQTLPKTETSPITAFGDLRRGLVFEEDTLRPVDGVFPFVMTYWLEGAQKNCGLSAYNRTTTYTLSTSNYSATSSSATTCFVVLPMD